MKLVRLTLALLPASLLATAAIAAAATHGGAGASFAPAKPTGHWHLDLSVDFASTGTATNSYCFPDPEAVDPTPASGSVSDKVTVRTVRSPVLEFHEAPNGIPVAQESYLSPSFRGKVTETRQGNLDSGGDPEPCFGTKKPVFDCGTRSVNSALYVSPLGGIHHWKGFTLELQESPAGRFARCGLTDADSKVPEPLLIDVKAPPRKLTGRAGKLVFRGSKKSGGSAKDETTTSKASGTLRWKVVLRRAGVGS